MKFTLATMADTVIDWFERFEIQEMKHDKKAFPVDNIILQVIQRADQARRLGDWSTALRDCNLALNAVTDQRRAANEDADKDTDDAGERAKACYTEATVRLYYGMVLLANSAALKNGASGYLDAALRQCEESARWFRESNRRCAEGIACMAAGLVNAGRKKWPEALNACRHSIEIIEKGKTAAQETAHKELCSRISRIIPSILDSYEEEEATLDETLASAHAPTPH